MLATRLDISFAVSRLSKFSHQSSILYAQALKHLLRYLIATKRLGLLYYEAPFSLDGYSDSDFAADPATRKSVGAYIFKLGHGPISWKTKQQTIVTISTMEAEYVALSDAARESIYLKNLLLSMQIEGFRL